MILLLLMALFMSSTVSASFEDSVHQCIENEGDLEPVPFSWRNEECNKIRDGGARRAILDECCLSVYSAGDRVMCEDGSGNLTRPDKYGRCPNDTDYVCAYLPPMTMR